MTQKPMTLSQGEGKKKQYQNGSVGTIEESQLQLTKKATSELSELGEEWSLPVVLEPRYFKKGVMNRNQ